jgi:hypothetical protein
MKKHRSMRGETIDLAKLMARQEKNITVGNTKSNARGDQLGEGGRIVKSADEIAREHYNRNDPKAVVQGGIKADDTPEINPTAVVDDWEEPAPVEETSPIVEEVEEEDPWVEDKDGNFVRQSELQGDSNESISKPKGNAKSKKTKSKGDY